MLCPNCESTNRDEAKFCDQCGFPLKSSEELLSENESDESAGDDIQDITDDTPTEDAANDDIPAKTPEIAADEADEAKFAGKIDDGEAHDAEDEADLEFASGQQADASQDALDERPLQENPQQVNGSIKYDLAGFDTPSDEFSERLVDPGYVEPRIDGRDGATMQMPRVESEPAPKSKDYLASATKEKSGSGKKIGVALAILAVIAAVIAFATYQMGIWGGKVIPDVVGMTEADAKSVLIDEGFTVQSQQVKSDDTEGLVLIMDPSASSRAEEGSEVTIHIATARTIPDVVGKTQEAAEKALAEAGYENVKTKKQTSDKKEGTVISVNPKEGATAKSSAEVTVKIAQPYKVPDVSGMLYDDAIDALKKAGLNADVAYISTDSYPEGTIIGTEPAAGTVVEKGAYVVIQITQAWGSTLEEAAMSYLAPGSQVNIAGSSYIIESLDSVQYAGNNTVSFSATAREYVTVFGSTVSNPATETVSGALTFTDGGEVIGIS